MPGHSPGIFLPLLLFPWREKKEEENERGQGIFSELSVSAQTSKRGGILVSTEKNGGPRRVWQLEEARMRAS